MKKLTSLPPEIRNNIYDLLIVHDWPIPIASPRKKHVLRRQAHSNFACLLRVNKQINLEAKTMFYARNEFIIGNGHWGSTTQANVQALKEFIRRVPKYCVSHIQNVALDIYLVRGYDRPSMYHKIRNEETSQLETISRALVRYFKGLERVTVAILPLAGFYRDRYDLKQEDLGGDIEAVAKPLRRLLAMPSLRELYFQIQSARNMKTLVDAVAEGKEGAKDKIKMVNRSGNLVLLF
ncbi:hypothetical protein N431DRAFT_385248 [Stipitochalara longipes BDJ]|nr:hypothetical protein N431DRAFT_385248 [Stipitochalara longipes BDJ]